MLSQHFWLPSPWWPNHNLQNKIKIFPAWQWHQSISSTLSYPWQHRSHPIQIKRVYNWPKSWPASRTCHFWLSPVSFSVTSWKNHCFKKPPQSNNVFVSLGLNALPVFILGAAAADACVHNVHKNKVRQQQGCSEKKGQKQKQVFVYVLVICTTFLLM